MFRITCSFSSAYGNLQWIYEKFRGVERDQVLGRIKRSVGIGFFFTVLRNNRHGIPK